MVGRGVACPPGDIDLRRGGPQLEAGVTPGSHLLVDLVFPEAGQAPPRPLVPARRLALVLQTGQSFVHFALGLCVGFCLGLLFFFSADQTPPPQTRKHANTHANTCTWAGKQSKVTKDTQTTHNTATKQQTATNNAYIGMEVYMRLRVFGYVLKGVKISGYVFKGA